MLLHFALRNRAFLVADLTGWASVPLIALLLRVDTFDAVEPYRPHLVAFTIVAMLCKLTGLWAFGLYRRYWRYASVDELANISLGVISAGIVAWILYTMLVAPFLPSGPRVGFAVSVIDTLLTLIFVGGTRFALRLADHLRHKLGGSVIRGRVLPRRSG